MQSSDIQRTYEKHAPFYHASAGRTWPVGIGIAASARGASVRLADGRELVDFASGGFGYAHPRVIEAVKAQVSRMPLSSRMFFSRPLALLAERLARLTPGALQVSFFGASGSEAMEGALKLARGIHPKRRRVVVARGAYHGSSVGALSVCGIEPLRQPLGELPLRAVTIPYGDSAALANAVDDETLAVVLEPVSTGRAVQKPPPGFFSQVRSRATDTRALLIVDEVTTGLGRTGHLFAIEAERVTPDVLVIGGALGAGALPIGAYVTTRELNARVYDRRDPLLHANTTGGNPSACTAALAGLDVIEQEGLVARARAHGTRLADALAALARDYPTLIRGVQTCGLLAAVRLPNIEIARTLGQRALERGVLVRIAGANEQHAWLSIRPPLLVERGELEMGIDALSRASADIGSGPKLPLEAAQ